MTRPGNTLALVLVSALLIVGVVGAFAAFTQTCETGNVERHKSEADKKGGAADALSKQGGTKDAAVDSRQPEIDRLQAEVDRLHKELARPKVGRPAVVPVPLPPVHGPSVVGDGVEEARGALVDDLQAENAKQRELIAAQYKLLAVKDLQIADLTAARDFHRAAERARADQVLSLEAALAAQKTISKAALWRGRVEGFAGGVLVGFGVGYKR